MSALHLLKCASLCTLSAWSWLTDQQKLGHAVMQQAYTEELWSTYVRRQEYLYMPHHAFIVDLPGSVQEYSVSWYNVTKSGIVMRVAACRDLHPRNALS